MRESLSIRGMSTRQKQRKFKHALPLSVARHGDVHTEGVRVAMTALTSNSFQ